MLKPRRCLALTKTRSRGGEFRIAGEKPSQSLGFFSTCHGWPGHFWRTQLCFKRAPVAEAAEWRRGNSGDVSATGLSALCCAYFVIFIHGSDL